MRSNMIDGVRRRMGFDNGFNVDPVGGWGGSVFGGITVLKLKFCSALLI